MTIIEKLKTGPIISGIAHLIMVNTRNTIHLRHLESVVVRPTDGAVTLAKSADIFNFHIDPDFALKAHKPGKDTVETTVDVYEQIKDGDFMTIFSSLGQDVRSRAMTQGQIRDFVWSQFHLLRQDNKATFFLFEVEGQLYVARVYVRRADKLRIEMSYFSKGFIWGADERSRLVVPRLSS